MIGRRTGIMLVGSLVAITACSTAPASDGPVAVPGVGQVAGPESPTSTTRPAGTAAPTTAGPPTTTTAPTTTPPTTAAPTTTAPTSTTSTTTTTTIPAATTTVAPAPTTTAPTPGVFDPLCVVVIQPGDSLGLIADRFDDPTVTVASLQAENGIANADLINAGSPIDVCVDNGLNDITGTERLGPGEPAPLDEGRRAVMAQQNKLNELFAGYGIRELLVDGISGPVTRQRLCAARLALGLPVSRADMQPGTLEEVALMFATALPTPQSSATQSERWALIDKTCQVMFVGSGQSLVFVFPASTGEAGYATRDQDRSRAFRYDPAVNNGGWHNSTTYPVSVDNPLNGNMYRPIYFDRGQAIHGSNNVPTTPQSKGCVRLRVADQDAFVAWLGLDGLTSATWSEDRIRLTVNAHGAYVPG